MRTKATTTEPVWCSTRHLVWSQLDGGDESTPASVLVAASELMSCWANGMLSPGQGRLRLLGRLARLRAVVVRDVTYVTVPRGGTSSGRRTQTYDTRVQSKIHSLANLAAARATCRLAAAARRSQARRGAQPTQDAGLHPRPRLCPAHGRLAARVRGRRPVVEDVGVRPPDGGQAAAQV